MNELLPYDGPALKELCDELDAWPRSLDSRGILPRRWEGRLRRDLEVEAVAASTQMEGVPVTVEEVRRILAGEPPAEVPDEDRAVVEGYRNAMSYVLRRADDAAFSWSRELIAGLHDRVLAGRHDHGAGRIRTETPAFVVNRLTGEPVFLPPAGELVVDLVDEACQRMNEMESHPAVASAWIHVAAAAIHPFRDGSGRAARVLASLAMYRGGYTRPEFTSLEEWWGRHLPDYYAAFECLGSRFDRQTEVTPFLVAHLTAQLQQVRALDLRERVQRQIWTVVEEVAEDSGLPPRLANALWDTFFGRDVSAGYYRSLAEVSSATATNDLAAAVAARLLESEGRTRARRYVAGIRLYELVGAALGIEVDQAPRDALRDRIIGRLSEVLRSSGEVFGFPRRPFDTSSRPGRPGPG